ncbi:hypothetical protein Syun_004242 [Stephania yunnanensis]|uniref:Remorin C-terminal domain-containing protein n=1 Tax=Stephania yunnanensis TaxID=152371 RepID=A0AAP0L3L5_9MAGN
MRSGVASQRTGACLSPGTPNYWHSSGGMPKGWSSERVPLPTNGGWRNVGVAVLPFYNGRTLPSKWEDAERWICSPVGGDGVNRSSVQLPHRRPKAKSGPLGPPGMALCSTYSPAVPTFGGRGVGNLATNSPFSAGVLAVNDLPDMGDGGNTDCGESHSVHGEACKLRSASIHGWSTDRINSQDEKPDGGDAKTASHTVSRRDVATQMSPDGSTHSSPKRRASSTSISPPLLPMVEAQTSLAKLEIRDVQVDSQVTLTRWSKKHGPLVSQRGSTNVESVREESAQIQDSAWNVGETATNSSRYKREDAKITAWENLQKAKAEASARRLEMKLEKKRAASMDKITKKLKLAQRRAQDMRSSISARQADQVARTSSEVAYFHRRRKMGFLSGCFACRLL